MTIARHVGAVLIVGTLVYVLCVISTSWPVIVVGCIGALLFVVAEVDELRPDRKTSARIDLALRLADERRRHG